MALLFRGHLKEGAQKSNEDAQELKVGAQASKGGAAPRYVALANSLDVSDESEDESNYSNSCGDHDGDIGNEVGDADLKTISDDDQENESDFKTTNDVGKEADGAFLPHQLL